MYSYPIVIIGDFNCHLNTSDSKALVLKDFLSTTNLIQCNVITNRFEKMLDLVCSNEVCTISRATFPLVPEDPHHPALSVDVVISSTHRYVQYGFCSYDTNESPNPNFNFWKADLSGLYMYLSTIDWSYLKNFTDSNLACLEFLYIIFDVFKKFVPFFSTTSASKRRYPPWFDRSIINDINLKHNLLKKRNLASAYYDSQIKLLSYALHKRIRKNHTLYMKSIEGNLRANPKDFWSFINKTKLKPQIPDSMLINNTLLNNPNEIVNAFATMFSIHCTATDLTPFSTHNHLYNYFCNDFFQVTNDQVLKAAKSLKATTVAGLDGIPSYIVRDCATVFCEPLCIIFNLALATGIFPQMWKGAKVIPVHKAGDKSIGENYRPIALLQNFAKVFEKTIIKIIQDSLLPVISEQQHGGVKSRSTATNLIHFTEFINAALQKGLQVDVIFLDFSKPFDRIRHDILFSKLQFLDLPSNLQSLLFNYLSQRSHRVSVGKYLSAPYIPSTGVPQGFSLGTPLFNVYINDVSDVISSKFLIYADDLKFSASFLLLLMQHCCNWT